MAFIDRNRDHADHLTLRYHGSGACVCDTNIFNNIIPRARMGSESRAHSGSRNNIVN